MKAPAKAGAFASLRCGQLLDATDCSSCEALNSPIDQIKAEKVQRRLTRKAKAGDNLASVLTTGRNEVEQRFSDVGSEVRMFFKN